jgi:hypothetical protein
MERDILERKQREAVLEEDRTTVALSRQADARANNRPKAKGGSRNVHREIR